MRHPSVAILAVVASLLPLVGPTAAAERAERRDPGMRWFSDLDKAIDEAKARNVPLFVAYHKDH